MKNNVDDNFNNNLQQVIQVEIFNLVLASTNPFGAKPAENVKRDDLLSFFEAPTQDKAIDPTNPFASILFDSKPQQQQPSQGIS